MNLPTRLRDARRLIESFDLRQIEAVVSQEARARLVIIGPVNSGKSTLFNQLKGQKISPVSAVPGTTVAVVGEQFGPFWLVDTPGLGEAAGGERAARAFAAVDQADVVVLVLDAVAGIRQSDVDLYEDLRNMGLAVVVALNKIDLLRRDLPAVVQNAEAKLAAPIIPISAKRGTNIAGQLIPAILDAHPRMAVTIGRYLPRFRRMAARRIIRESGLIAALIGMEPIPGADIPLLIGIQVRLLLRLGAIYGQDMSIDRARELIGAIAGGVAIRYGAQELAKLIPGPGWLIAGAAAGTGTVALGNAAIVFFERSLSPRELRALYRRIRWRRQASLEAGSGRDGND
jgi:small GTP-binding protein